MDPNTARAALLGAAFYHPAAAVAASAVADMVHAQQQYYAAQNIANFANMTALYSASMAPMSMYGLQPPPSHSSLQQMQPMQPHSQATTTASTSASTMISVGGYGGGFGAGQYNEGEAGGLQRQMVARFSQASPQQQTSYYQDIRQHLHAATSELNDNQKQALLNLDPTLEFTIKDLDAAAVTADSSSNDVEEPKPTPRSLAKRAYSTGGNSCGGGGAAAVTATPPAAKRKYTKRKKSSNGDEASLNASPAARSDLGLMHVSPANGSSSASSSPFCTVAPVYAPSVPSPAAAAATPSPRGRPPGKKLQQQPAAGDMVTEKGKKKVMTPLAEEARARKAKMTWPKGTFILRLQDIAVRNGRDHIWLVDNHQLLQRFNNETGIQPDGTRIYHKTDRYTGWLCHEGYHYFPLFDQQHILSYENNDKITVRFPADEELQHAIAFEEQERARRKALRPEEDYATAAAAAAASANLRPLPPSLRKYATTSAAAEKGGRLPKQLLQLPPTLAATKRAERRVTSTSTINGYGLQPSESSLRRNAISFNKSASEPREEWEEDIEDMLEDDEDEEEEEEAEGGAMIEEEEDDEEDYDDDGELEREWRAWKEEDGLCDPSTISLAGGTTHASPSTPAPAVTLKKEEEEYEEGEQYDDMRDLLYSS